MNLKTNRRAAARIWTSTGIEPKDRPLNSTSYGNHPALDVLTAGLLAELLGEVRDPVLRERFRRAAAESASIAWSTPYPLLTLPELFAEKEREVLRQHERQQAIQGRNRPLLAHAE